MRFNSTNLLAGILIVFLYSSCGPAYHIRQGNRLHDQMAYSMAIEEYEKGLPKKPVFDAQVKLAESYRLMNNTAKAEEAYAKVVESSDAQPIHKLRYAQLLMKAGKYSSAKLWLENYLKSNPTDKTAQDMLASCDLIEQIKKDSIKYVVEPAKINTGQSNFSPTAYKDGIVFVSDRTSGKGKVKTHAWTGKPFLDIYYVKSDGKDEWGQPELLKGEINGIYHEGPVAFGNDSVMYLTRNNYIKRKTKTDDDEVVRLKIYEVRKRSEAWTALTEVPFNSNDYSTGHPALMSDGNTMYFISDMPGTLGGTDIWISKKVNDQWGTPVNAGPIINTPFNEAFPYVYNDTTLYFSSEGHINMGGLDIFHAKINAGESISFSEAKNIGYPINSSHDDFGILVDSNGETGYFSSNRQSTMQDQIYTLKKRDLRFIVDGIVVEKGTDNAIDLADVEIKNKTTGKKEKMATGPDGKFTFLLDPESDYIIVGSKPEYYTNSDVVTTIGRLYSDDMTIKVRLELEKIIIDKPIVLKNIYYDLDKADIRPDAALELDKLVAVLEENPGINIELSSHTDSRADDKYNMKLSQRRAQAAVDYIISRGVNKDRLVAKGYGESKLINHCINKAKCTEAEHQQNRRTEFKVTSITKKTTL